MQVESALQFETPREIFSRVYTQLHPRQASPSIDVQFRAFTSANSNIRQRGGALLVRITDLLAEAPNPVIEALAWILLSKLARRPVPESAQQLYRRYMNQSDMRSRIHDVRQQRGHKRQLPAAGQHIDLEALFHRLNGKYFAGALRRPQLGWSARSSRTRLGHYDASHHSITLSRIFDRPGAPLMAIEYVMFHEMLHIAHPTEHDGARRSIHTASFRKAERAYPEYKEAKQCLDRWLTQKESGHRPRRNAEPSW